MKIITGGKLILNGLLFALIILASIQAPAETDNTQKRKADRYRTHQTASSGDTEMQLLMQQADTITARYQELQKSGSSLEISEARQRILSLSESLATKIADMTGHSRNDIQAMHDSGLHWENIMNDLAPQNLRDRQHANQPMIKDHDMTPNDYNDQPRSRQSSGMMRGGGRASGGESNSGGGKSAGSHGSGNNNSGGGGSNGKGHGGGSNGGGRSGGHGGGRM